MEVDGVSLTMGGAAVSAIAGLAGAWVKARYGKIEVTPTPLPVAEQDKFITRSECKRLMCAHDTAISELRSDIKTGNINILHKLEAMDRKSEERAQKTHERLDPFIRELGAVHGKMEIIEKAELSATMGGEK